LAGSLGCHFDFWSPASLISLVNGMSEFESLSDHFILQLYEFIRRELRADALTGTRLVGLPARQRAEALFGEIDRRGLICTPIDRPQSS
jgi:hypothetical protein